LHLKIEVAMATLQAKAIEEFKQNLRGKLILPEDKEYDEARKLYCFQDTSGIAKLSKDLRVQGVNFFARRGIYESYVSASPNASSR
jgi:hypothetical protein